MDATEDVSVKEVDEALMPCKSRKRFIIASLATIMGVVLFVVIIVTAALLQVQIPQGVGSTMASVTMDLSVTATEVPLAVITIGGVPSEMTFHPTSKQGPEIEEDIYFGTYIGGLKAYSVSNSSVRTIASRSEYVYGVVHDSTTDKLYWSTRSKIYKGNRDGSQVETLLSTDQYGWISGLDLDWITGNLFGVTTLGFILACGTRRTFACATLLRGQGQVEGVAADPTTGVIYFTVDSGTIYRAAMDGSGRVAVVTGRNRPRAIVIDFEGSRLLWTCTGDNKVQSSDLQGRNIQTLAQRPHGSWTHGLALSRGRLYWSNSLTGQLESSTKTGQDIRLLHSRNSDHWLMHLGVVPRPSLPSHRINHCAGRGCEGVCVLTQTSSFCVS